MAPSNITATEVIAILEVKLGSKIPEVPKIRWNTFGILRKRAEIFGVGLYKRPLEALPNELFSCTELEVLSLTGGGLKEIPRNIQSLTNLKEFYVGGNELRFIPEEIGNLQNLHTLYILEDSLESIPESVVNLEILQEFSVSSNFLTNPTQEMLEIKKKGCQVFLNNIEI